jgi:hypothetical protein
MADLLPPPGALAFIPISLVWVSAGLLPLPETFTFSFTF